MFKNFSAHVRLHCCNSLNRKLFLGESAPGQGIQEERQPSREGESVVAVYNPNASMSIEQQRQKLPIFKVCAHKNKKKINTE